MTYQPSEQGNIDFFFDKQIWFFWKERLIYLWTCDASIADKRNLTVLIILLHFGELNLQYGVYVVESSEHSNLQCFG